MWITFSFSLVIYEKMDSNFFLTQVTLAKVTKCPWHLASISDGFNFIPIATEKWKISVFPIQMPMKPKLTLVYNRSRSTQGNDLYKLCSTTDPDATRMSPVVLEKKIFKILSIFEHGGHLDGHLGHVTWTFLYKFSFPLSRRLHIKLGFDWPSAFRGEDVWTLLTTTTTPPE